MEAALGELETALVVLQLQLEVPLGELEIALILDMMAQTEVQNSSQAVCLHTVNYKIHIYHS